MPRMLHPIHYSLLINLAILTVTGLLAWAFVQPLIVVIGLMVLQHMPGRFPPDDQAGQTPDPGPRIGFLANVGDEEPDYD